MGQGRLLSGFLLIAAPLDKALSRDVPMQCNAVGTRLDCRLIADGHVTAERRFQLMPRPA